MTSQFEFLVARVCKHALTYVDCLAQFGPLQRTFGPSFVFYVSGFKELGWKGAARVRIDVTPMLRTRPRLYMTRDLRDVVWRSIRQPTGAWKERKSLRKRFVVRASHYQKFGSTGAYWGGGGWGGERERGKGGGGYPGFDVLSGPWRTVLRKEDSPCRRRQRHFEGWLKEERHVTKVSAGQRKTGRGGVFLCV